jgi:hypothetical protein
MQDASQVLELLFWLTMAVSLGCGVLSKLLGWRKRIREKV